MHWLSLPTCPNRRCPEDLTRQGQHGANTGDDLSAPFGWCLFLFCLTEPDIALVVSVDKPPGPSIYAQRELGECGNLANMATSHTDGIRIMSIHVIVSAVTVCSVSEQPGIPGLDGSLFVARTVLYI